MDGDHSEAERAGSQDKPTAVPRPGSSGEFAAARGSGSDLRWGRRRYPRTPSGSGRGWVHNLGRGHADGLNCQWVRSLSWALTWSRTWAQTSVSG